MDGYFSKMWKFHLKEYPTSAIKLIGLILSDALPSHSLSITWRERCHPFCVTKNSSNSSLNNCSGQGKRRGEKADLGTFICCTATNTFCTNTYKNFQTQQKQSLQVATGKYFIVCFISKVRSTFLFNWWEASIFILPWTMLDWDLQSSILHSVTKKSICFELHHNRLSFAVLSQAFYEVSFLSNFRHKFNFFFF